MKNGLSLILRLETENGSSYGLYKCETQEGFLYVLRSSTKSWNDSKIRFIVPNKMDIDVNFIIRGYAYTNAEILPRIENEKAMYVIEPIDIELGVIKTEIEKPIITSPIKGVKIDNKRFAKELIDNGILNISKKAYEGYKITTNDEKQTFPIKVA